MTTIRDDLFCRQYIANSQDCRAVDRYLNAVDEVVTVLRACQDPNTPSLVIIDYTLVGAYEFQPSCQIIEVDGEEYDDVFAPFVPSHYINPDLPLRTNCATLNGQLVFDFAEVIPEFTQSQVIIFKLIMEGTTPSSFGVSFPNQTATHTYRWEKGALPRPLSMLFTAGQLTLVFDYTSDRDCSCNIHCIYPSGVTDDVIFCEDEPNLYNIDYGDLDGDPQYISLLLKDSLGNESKLNIQGLINTDVKPPILSSDIDPKRVEVSIPRQALNGDALEEVEYQVQKYEETEGQYSVWKDWSHRNWANFVDYNVSKGMKYSYRVRYRDKLNNVSNFSEWRSVVV